MQAINYGTQSLCRVVVSYNMMVPVNWLLISILIVILIVENVPS